MGLGARHSMRLCYQTCYQSDPILHDLSRITGCGLPSVPYEGSALVFLGSCPGVLIIRWSLVRVQHDPLTIRSKSPR